MSELASWIRHLNATKNDDPSCRYCWRPLFDHDGRWDLVYREYENTLACDARGDSVMLSTLPHEPAPYYAATIGKLIELAAQVISEPGSFRDTDEARDWALVRLITEAAGLTAEDEDYVFAAIIRVAVQSRDQAFRQAAYRYRATEPWDGYWRRYRTRGRVHKASPGGPGSWDERENVANCARCGQRIKLVPGGQGMTWVHSDSGAVAAPNPQADQR